MSGSTGGTGLNPYATVPLHTNESDTMENSDIWDIDTQAEKLNHPFGNRSTVSARFGLNPRRAFFVSSMGKNDDSLRDV